MNVNILTQVIRQRRYPSSPSSKIHTHDDESQNEKLIYKDVAGFIILLVVSLDKVWGNGDRCPGRPPVGK